MGSRELLLIVSPNGYLDSDMRRCLVARLGLNRTKGRTSTETSSYCECGVRLFSTCRMAMVPTRHRHCGPGHDLERETSFRLESLHFSIELKELAWLGRPGIRLPIPADFISAGEAQR